MLILTCCHGSKDIMTLASNLDIYIFAATYARVIVCIFSSNHVGESRLAQRNVQSCISTFSSDYFVVIWALHRLGAAAT